MLGFGRPADREARRAWWRRQVEQHQRSNLSIAEFCRRNGLSEVTFYHWRRRFRGASAAVVGARRTEASVGSVPASAPAFVPVSIVGTGSVGQLEVELPNA